jgi:membrane protease YdiL (CAAX protease family)
LRGSGIVVKIFQKQIIFTVVYCMLFAFGTYYFSNMLESSGMNSFYAYSLTMNILFLMMLVHGLIGIKRNTGTYKFWVSSDYKKIKKENIRWIVGIFVIEMIVFLILSFVHDWSNGWMVYPKNTPLFNLPNVDYVSILDNEIGFKGNYMLLIVTFITLLLNVFGEEILWRGYMFNEQLKQNQRNSVWIIHGLLWTFFHAFKYYDLIIIIPVSLGLSFVVYKTRNNMNGLLFHFLTNGTTLIGFLILVIFGN